MKSQSTIAGKQTDCGLGLSHLECSWQHGLLVRGGHLWRQICIMVSIMVFLMVRLGDRARRTSPVSRIRFRGSYLLPLNLKRSIARPQTAERQYVTSQNRTNGPHVPTRDLLTDAVLGMYATSRGKSRAPIPAKFNTSPRCATGILVVHFIPAAGRKDSYPARGGCDLVS